MARMKWQNGKSEDTRSMLRGVVGLGSRIDGAPTSRESYLSKRQAVLNEAHRPPSCDWCERRPLYTSSFNKATNKFYGACKEHKHLLPRCR